MPNTYLGNKLPVFPATWYHPIYGAKEIKTIEEYSKLDHNWREHPGVADMDRTETESQLVMLHNQLVKHAEALERAKALKGKDDPDRDKWEKAIVRNSVQAQESINRGDPEPL